MNEWYKKYIEMLWWDYYNKNWYWTKFITQGNYDKQMSFKYILLLLHWLCIAIVLLFEEPKIIDEAIMKPTKQIDMQ